MPSSDYNIRMGSKSLRRYIGGLLILVSLPLAIWGIMPQRSNMQRVTVNSPALQNQTVVADIDVPHLMRLGETGWLRVAISLDKPDPPANDGRDVSVILETGQGETRSSSVLSRARFELARLPVIPTGELIETFRHGTPGVFIWRIIAEESGEFPGRIWLYIQPQSGKPNNEDLILTEPLTIQPLILRVVSILGLRLEFIKLNSFVGLTLGVLLLGDELHALLIRVKRKSR